MRHLASLFALLALMACTTPSPPNPGDPAPGGHHGDEPPPDPLGQTLAAPPADTRVHSLSPSQDGLRLLPSVITPPEVTCMKEGVIHADPDQWECSDQVGCRQWSCHTGCHGGAHPQDIRECEADSCPQGQVCASMPGDQGCGAMDTRCLPDCRDAGCAAGLVCAEDGLCRPPDCRWSGQLCGPNTACAELEGWGWCMPRGCRADNECDCGTCVGGTCHNGPGRCEAPRP